jgi:hypothetical protein
MKRLEPELAAHRFAPGAAGIYCMAALVVEEAAQHGCGAFAKAVEKSMDSLLAGLPREQQREALLMSYEMALDGEDPAPPRLRLVYSRD